MAPKGKRKSGPYDRLLTGSKSLVAGEGSPTGLPFVGGDPSATALPTVGAGDEYERQRRALAAAGFPNANFAHDAGSGDVTVQPSMPGLAPTVFKWADGGLKTTGATRVHDTELDRMRDEHQTKTGLQSLGLNPNAPLSASGRTPMPGGEGAGKLKVADKPAAKGFDPVAYYKVMRARLKAMGVNVDPTIKVGGSSTVQRRKMGVTLDPRWVALEQKYTKGMEDSLNLQAKVAARSADVIAGAKEKMAGDIKGRATARGEKSAAFFADVRKQYADLTAKYQELGEKRINPQRWWSNLSTANKIGMSLSVFASTLAGKGKEAMAMVSKFVDRDIAAQKTDLVNQAQSLHGERGILGDLMRVYKDEQQAEIALEQLLYKSTSMQVDAMADRAKGTMAGLRFRMMGHQIRQVAASKMVERTAQKWAVTTSHTSGRTVQNQVLSKLAAAAMKAPTGQDEKLNQKSREKVAGVISGTDSMRQLYGLFQKHGGLGRIAFITSKWPPAASARVERLKLDLAHAIITAREGGRVTDQDVAIKANALVKKWDTQASGWAMMKAQARGLVSTGKALQASWLDANPMGQKMLQNAVTHANNFDKQMATLGNMRGWSGDSPLNPKKAPSTPGSFGGMAQQMLNTSKERLK